MLRVNNQSINLYCNQHHSAFGSTKTSNKNKKNIADTKTVTINYKKESSLTIIVSRLRHDYRISFKYTKGVIHIIFLSL